MPINLVGSWKLLNCKQFDSNGLPEKDPFQDASGMIIYDSDGMMSAHLMRSDHKSNLSNDIHQTSLESFKSLCESYIAYYGHYSINNDKNIVTHHVIGALWPSLIGEKLHRRFKFIDDNTLILCNITPEAIGCEKPIVRYLTWQRLTTSK